MHVYDEYEEEYLQNIPDLLAIEMTPFDEKNQSAKQNQEVEMRKDNEGTGGDSLPLCYASFELIRHIIKASKKRKKKWRWRRTETCARKEVDAAVYR